MHMITKSKENGRKHGDLDSERAVGFDDLAALSFVFGTAGFSVKGVRA